MCEVCPVVPLLYLAVCVLPTQHAAGLLGLFPKAKTVRNKNNKNNFSDGNNRQHHHLLTCQALPKLTHSAATKNSVRVRVLLLAHFINTEVKQFAQITQLLMDSGSLEVCMLPCPLTPGHCRPPLAFRSESHLHFFPERLGCVIYLPICPMCEMRFSLLARLKFLCK